MIPAMGLSMAVSTLVIAVADGVTLSGLDGLTISRRLGHASPVVTLAIYGHLFGNTDSEAASAIEAALRTRVER
jgi:integrase